MTKLSERITKIETTTHIQFKELFFRLKRLESILYIGMGSVLMLLVTVLFQIH